MPSLATMPLDQLPVLSLDLETTGLNTRQDRVLQIGLISGDGEPPEDGAEFLVNPDVPIPANSTAIHGLSADDVAAAPPFPVVFSACRDRLSNRVLIGYNIGFDLAILSAETDRHGMEWRWGQALCLRQLATIALGRNAMLMMGDLDSLAAHYSIDISQRHSALGDAVISLALYRALVLDLRGKSVTTLGEAKRAVAELDDERMATARAGWVDVASPKDEVLESQPLARIDPFPYRHRIAEIMMTDPLIRPRTTTLLEAAKTLSKHRADCLFVGTGPEAIEGIVSERNIVDALSIPLAAHERARDIPLHQIMSGPVISVQDNDHMHVALGRLARHDIRHLGVKDISGGLIGWLSTRQLIRQRVSDALVIGDEIQHASTSQDMASALASLPSLAASLMSEGVPAPDIASVISGEYRHALARAAALAEEMMTESHGPPPRPYAVLVLGSAGRGESLLAADQDHAIIYDDKAAPIAPEEASGIQNYYQSLGGHIADILDAAGIPYCKGGVMSSTPEWCQSLTSWRNTIRGWCRSAHPKDVLMVDIFFDFTLVYGDGQLGTRLQQATSGRAARQPDFLKLLAKTIGQHHGGVNFFGGLKLTKGRYEVKRHLLLPLVEFLRVMAISRGVQARNSRDRARAVLNTASVPPEVLQLGEDVQFSMRLVLRQQIRDIAAGLAPGSSIDPDLLTDQEEKLLKAVRGRISRLDGLLQDCLFH